MAYEGTNICEMLDMYTKGELLVLLVSWSKEMLHGDTVKCAVRDWHPEVYISSSGGICHRFLVWNYLVFLLPFTCSWMGGSGAADMTCSTNPEFFSSALFKV